MSTDDPSRFADIQHIGRNSANLSFSFTNPAMAKETIQPARSPFDILPMTALFCMVFFSLLFFSPVVLPAIEVSSRYAALHYSTTALLAEANDNIEMRRALSSWRSNKDILTAEDELLAKVDSIVEHAEIVLDMFPDKLKITIILLADASAVTSVFKEKYGKGTGQIASYSLSADHIAFYSLSADTIYISAEDINHKVLAHEIGHAIVDRYFKTRVPTTIHELLAQFTEKHISD